MSIAEVVATMAVNVVVLVGLLWVQLRSPIVVEGEAVPLFDPAMWSFWLPWFIVVTLLEIALTIAVYVHGRWTYPAAVGNALLGAAFAIPAVYLLANGLLLNPSDRRRDHGGRRNLAGGDDDDHRRCDRRHRGVGRNRLLPQGAERIVAGGAVCRTVKQKTPFSLRS